MCGLVAYLDFSEQLTFDNLNSSTDSMRLRGPDARGTLILSGNNFNVGFGHRRLSILDIDDRSNQPFILDNFTIVYNGEIYNFNEIKAELVDLGYDFKTTSDTEVILQAYKQWGKSCVERFIGMFAFFIYDAAHEKIVIVRDRLGVKPLYIYRNEQTIIVASQLNAFKPLLGELLSVDKGSLHGFFALGFIPGESSIYSEIKKVKPGAIIELDILKENNKDKKFDFKESIYWDINKVRIQDLSNKNKKICLKELLKDAIKLRLVSDVKVGSYLSGGLDSSYVTKLMKNYNDSLDSFTIGFDNKYDEAPHAKRVAEYIGTMHHSHYLEPEDVKNIIFNFTEYFDEPFSDDAAIPMLFLSQMSKKNVKVVISSDGGDELFAGYSRYKKALLAQKRISKIPYFLLFPIKHLASFLQKLLPKRNKLNNSLWRLSRIISNNKERRLANLLLYGDMIPTPELESLLDKKVLTTKFHHNYFAHTGTESSLKQLLFIDIKEKLVNQMLVKVDRSTMGASIEGREPLLDHRLFEFMTACADEDLINKNQTKYLFRKVIREEFNNNDILNKPKMGFNTPIYDWLRFSFFDYVEKEFKSIESNHIPYINQDVLLEKWAEFKDGKFYYQSLIWRSLIWIQWFKSNRSVKF